MTPPTYFALEGITCSGKTTVMGWMGDLLEKEGYKYNLIPKPVEQYKMWKTYDPLIEMYQNSFSECGNGTNAHDESRDVILFSEHSNSETYRFRCHN